MMYPSPVAGSHRNPPESDKSKITPAIEYGGMPIINS